MILCFTGCGTRRNDYTASSGWVIAGQLLDKSPANLLEWRARRWVHPLTLG